MQYVLDHYLPRAATQRLTALGNAGGFSGAALWKWETERGVLCVRRWPKSRPDASRLAWMARVLSHAFAEGCTFLPVPWVHSQGEPFVSWQGHLWEVSPWMPGVADYHRHPSGARLEDAMRSLARFHQATRSLQREEAPFPGLLERQAKLDALDTGGWESLQHHVLTSAREGFTEICAELLHAARQARAELPPRGCGWSAARPLQICLRDVWHDHVLFSGEEVTGIVDFGAMRMEAYILDVARLLGSLVADDEAGWLRGWQAYRTHAPAVEDDLPLLRWLDQVNQIVGAVHWIEWLLVQGRQFGSEGDVRRRLASLLLRLQGRGQRRQ